MAASPSSRTRAARATATTSGSSFWARTGCCRARNVLENTVEKITTEGAASAKPVYFFLERYMRAYEIEWNAFVEALENGTEMPATLRDGVAALACAEAATRSQATGQPGRDHPRDAGRRQCVIPAAAPGSSATRT